MIDSLNLVNLSVICPHGLCLRYLTMSWCGIAQSRYTLELALRIILFPARTAFCSVGCSLEANKDGVPVSRYQQELIEMKENYEALTIVLEGWKNRAVYLERDVVAPEEDIDSRRTDNTFLWKRKMKKTPRKIPKRIPIEEDYEMVEAIDGETVGDNLSKLD
ncbi:chromosome partition protein MukB [Striga asiatica]|uniref:Chromosome partition protein MukB n=1 Tax=Striga asiatica TaxID=4170 RepID=A0A5A7QBU1_STRAF|nr:chromosome partition protein MukB [Striga asiatica]